MGQACNRPSPETVIESLRSLTTRNRNIEVMGTLTLDSFELNRTIGTGGYSHVKLARHKATGKPVALKIMNKAKLQVMKQVTHVFTEKHVLLSVKSSFIIDCLGTFQDSTNLYCVLEYMPGGELFRRMCDQDRLCRAEAQFYIAEVVLAICQLHLVNCVYRDLKPENLLLAATGHLKLADFGFAKFLSNSEKTYTTCGTPEYLAPEVISQTGASKPLDWWQVGILLYEMLVGRTPFIDTSPFMLYEKILTYSVEFSEDFDPVARDLVSGLLAKKPEERFTQKQILAHPFFMGIIWEEVRDLKVTPPFDPHVKNDLDSHYFDDYEQQSISDLWDEAQGDIFAGY